MVHTRHMQSSPDSPKEKNPEVSPNSLHYEGEAEKQFRSPVKYQKKTILNGVEDHVDDFGMEESRIDKQDSINASSHHSPALSERGKLEFEDDRRRRSGRERRFMYGTFNQSAIADVYLGMGDIEGTESVSSRHRRSSSNSPKRNKMIIQEPAIPRRRGRRPKRSFVQMNNPEAGLINNDSSNLNSSVVSTDEVINDDMYTRIKRQRRENRRVTYDDFITSVQSRRRSKTDNSETRIYPRRSLRQRSSPVQSELPVVKRGRRLVHEKMESPINKKEESNDEVNEKNEVIENGDEEEDEEEEEEEEEEDESSESSEEAPRKYSLRERRGPPIPIYQPDFGERRLRRSRIGSLIDSRRHHDTSVCRPRGRRARNLMRRSTAHNRGSSSTSSSSSSDSESGTSADEARFERRKAKSMARARKRCLPMNFTEEDLKGHSALRDRSIVGASLADIEPMTIDKSVTFESIGGLDDVVRSLKEMVLFPLLYPEVFTTFNIAPPRGVLFHGPPGTGKTLVARALANSCSEDSGRKVAFYMRKGADCLSKWVGESERQLRLLFNEAYTMRPSIIFFDEIDGLAPVRSTRQDQIHSSIVSTLLALLDGLDSRGEVVVIGATNRLDAIDPALRRPGRFDREFFFPLPREAARLQIIQIHTTKWPVQLAESTVERLAKATSGYCGADLKTLCTEAVLSGLRRRYPQVYVSKVKLQLNLKEIQISETDFQVAMESIVAAGQRVECSPSRPLSEAVIPLVKDALNALLERIRKEFPSAAQVLRRLDNVEDNINENLIAEDPIDEHGQAHSWGRMVLGGRGPRLLYRPRLLLLPGEGPNENANNSWDDTIGEDGETQLHNTNTIDQHLLPAVFHRLEGIHVFTIDTPALFHVSARTPEESLSQLWREALRLAPSIIYIPHVNELVNSLPETVVHCLTSLIQGGDPTARIFILATVSDAKPLRHRKLDQFFAGCWYRCSSHPSLSARRLFFNDVFLNWPSVPPPQRKITAQRMLEVLPVAPESEQQVQRKLSSKEAARLFEHEESAMCQLRLLLREVLAKLNRDRRFTIFARPVDREEVPDYYDIIKKPMDLSTISRKLDTHQYETTKAFLDDIDQICSNALEYNPDTTPADRELRHRACCMRDFAISEIKMLISDEFIERCEYIASARKKRGVDGSSTMPNFYLTRRRTAHKGPVNASLTPSTQAPPEKSTPQQTTTPNSVSTSGSLGAIPGAATGHRLSRRLKQLAPEANEIPQRRRSRTKRRESSPVSGDPPALVLDTEELDMSLRRASPLHNTDRVCNGVPSTPSPETGEKADESGECGVPTTVSPEACSSEKKESTAINRPSGERKQEKMTIPRLTRGLAANNPLAERALAILEQPTPHLTVPTHQLAMMSDRCVRKTDGWSVSRLEHLYSRLVSRLIPFEREWDRTRLASEFEEILKSFNL